MKTTIGVYDNHQVALNAVIELKNSGYHLKNVSILGKAKTEILDNEMNITAESPLRLEDVAVGTIVGTTIGVLTGLGLFAVPGLGVLMGAGALVGAIAGFDFGLIGGGIASVLIRFGIHRELAKKYQRYLEEDKFLLIVNGKRDDVNEATDILANHGTHIDLEAHILAEKANLEIAEEKEHKHNSFISSLDTQFPLSGGEQGL